MPIFHRSCDVLKKKGINKINMTELPHAWSYNSVNWSISGLVV